MTDEREVSATHARSARLFRAMMTLTAAETAGDAAGGIHSWHAFRKILKAGRARSRSKVRSLRGESEGKGGSCRRGRVVISSIPDQL